MTKDEAYAIGKIKSREDMVTLADKYKEAGVLLTPEEINALPLVERTNVQIKAFKLGAEVRAETVDAFNREIQHEENAEELSQAFVQSMATEGIRFLNEMAWIGETEFLRKILEEEKQRREEETS